MSDKVRILVVDDGPQNLRLLADLLTVEGYDVTTATSGPEALARVAEDRPDLVLLDVVMPEMDGYEVCRRLRAAPDTRLLPVVMVTALDPEEERIKGIEAGADDFLPKPIRRAELLARVRSLLRIRSLHEQLRTMFATASHDLRGPLQALELLVGALGQQPLEAKARALTQQIQSSVTALSEMFDSLLDVSRLEAGLLEPERRHVAVAPLLEQLAAEGRPQAERRGLALRVEETSAWVRTDPRLLRRILQNLVTNALRYTDAGEIVLACRESDGRAWIEVRDTGRGIPPEQRARIFEAHRRLDPRDGARAQGLGLGLSIVKRLVTQLGHELDLESTPGADSSFRVGVLLGDPARGESPPERMPDARFENALVYVVDDDPAIRSGLSELLSGWGCRSRCAAGLEELSAYESDAVPSVVLADYHLSEGATGIEAIAALRERWGVDLPAALLTADAVPRIVSEASRHGLLLLRKPVSPMRLRAALSHLLRKGD